jgi:DNA invertase Pin-like site-specific DNA recombinase
MLAVLGGLADVERDLIRTRTAEGRSRTKAQGKQMGRAPSLNDKFVMYSNWPVWV